MNYAGINACDMCNGEGLRVSLFVSGCRIGCKGCFNKKAWDFKYGKEFTKDTREYILSLVNQPHIKGLSILGGEPLDDNNRDTVRELVKYIKLQLPEKDIWLWTGYDISKFYNDPILDYLDVVVDGKFIKELKDPSLKYRGSINQKIHIVEDIINERLLQQLNSRNT